MATCFVSRYEDEGFDDASDWVVAHIAEFTTEELEGWWYDAPGGEKPDGARPTAGSDTCLLPEGHAGPHVWTPENDIIFQFVDGPPVTFEQGGVHG